MTDNQPVTFKSLNLTEPEESDFDLSFWMNLLLREEPFFAHVSRYIRKRATKDIPTAGVFLNPDTFSYELIYNPNLFLSIEKSFKEEGKKQNWDVATVNEKIRDTFSWILKHEMYHICLGHCTTRSPGDGQNKKNNIGMDEAINSLPNMIKDAPDWVYMPGRPVDPSIPKTDLAWVIAKHPVEQAMEWYINNLPNVEKEDSWDFHAGWMADGAGDLSEGVGQIAKEKIDTIIRKAVEDAEKNSVSGDKSWGSISAGIQKAIKNYVTPKLDPEKVLAAFVKNSIRAEKKKRITKINHRYPYIHPGRAWNRRPQIAVSIDQSGSVSDQLLEKFFGWLNKLSTFADFTVIPFDSHVDEDKIYVWKRGEQRKTERVLQGGTDFNAPTKYVNDRNFDGHIICTDLQAPKPIESKCQRMWISDAANVKGFRTFVTNERVLAVD